MPAPLALILVLAAIEALTWMFVVPALQGPDEVGHFTYVQRIVENHEIPLTTATPANPPGVAPYSTEVGKALVEGGLGPLAANIGARPYWTKADFRVWAHANSLLHEPDRKDGGFTSSFRNPPLYYLYESVPYGVLHSRSFYAREMFMRLANIPLLLVALVFVWLLAGELLGRGRGQVIATATAALLPQVVNITATINPDVLLVAEWSAALYVMTLVVTRGPSRGRIGLLAALCVASALTHPRGAPIFVAAALAVLVALARERGWRRLTPARAALGLGGIYALGAFVVAGAGIHGNGPQFLSYLWQYYLPKLGFMQHKLGPQSYGFRRGTVDRLYGTLAQLEVVLPHTIETILYWLTIAALIGLVAALVRRRSALRAHGDVAIVLGFSIYVLLLGMHLVAYRGLADQPNDPVFTARYLLPLLPLFGVALAITASALPRRASAVFVGCVLAIGVALQFESLGLLVERFYA